MKNILYRSTRSSEAPITSSAAILRGLSGDGGLYVPCSIPVLDHPVKDYAEMDYRTVAYEVMKLFLTDYTEEELRYCVDGAYSTGFDSEEIAPMAEAMGNYYLELFHGRTIAFKDMALSILPYLMTTAAKKNGDSLETVILTATSGDTGKAALAGFAGVPGTRIVVFFPNEGVSAIQKRQMVTQEGSNTCVIGITGNFDDAQTGVKRIFTDPEMRSRLEKGGFRFSSANSINIGRLVPQIAYYVFAYSRLVREERINAGDPVNFTVPTGNFGNILAAYYAARMGLPVGKLICASNRNKVLFDFFRTGVYDRNREFYLTGSPSMDILVSSNLERLIYHISGEDCDKTADLMHSLSSEGKYVIDDGMRSRLDLFASGYADDGEAMSAIRDLYENTGYVIDPHTAVASFVAGQYRGETGDLTPNIIVSTASPFKFGSTVLKALGKPVDADDMELADRLSVLANVPVPYAVESLRHAEVRHTTVCSSSGMADEVLRFLGLQ